MTPPRHVAVVGAGFAGLSCAVSLASRGVRVTVLEARRAAGGRAASFLDEESGETLDNGQHLLMACYRETRRFLAAVGTLDKVRFQPDLHVLYLSPRGPARLRCPRLPAPWHLLAGALGIGVLGGADRLALLRAAPALAALRRRGGLAALEGLSVEAWLDRLGQTEALRRWLWHPLAVATLNAAPAAAPAALLGRVLLEGFMRRRVDSGLGIASVGLADLYVEPARRLLGSRGGVLETGAPVAALRARDGAIEAVVTRDGRAVEADAFVCSAPPQALGRITVEGGHAPPAVGLDRFAASPILSVNLWPERPLPEIADFDFAGLVGTRTQWLFNKQRVLGGRAAHLAAVVSAADDLVGRGAGDLAGTVWEDVRACLPEARGARLARSLVVRERTATFAATLSAEACRPGPATPYRNLLLAGDWTERGWPATIEAAVRSGHRCADLLTTGGPTTS